MSIYSFKEKLTIRKGGVIKICTIIILYNKTIDEKNALNNEEVDLYYLDNSINKEIIEKNSKFNNCISFKENKGLSYAYNFAIDKFKDSYDYLLILDDDSILDSDFFSNMKNAINEFPLVDIFIPTVISTKTGNKSYPIYVNDNVILYKLKYKCNKLRSINSGLIIKLDENTIKFNEKLFLYSVDFDYFKTCKDREIIHVSNAILYQNFSREDFDYQNIKRRYSLEMVDSIYYYNSLNYIINYFITSLYLTFKSKNIKCFFIINMNIIRYLLNKYIWK